MLLFTLVNKTRQKRFCRAEREFSLPLFWESLSLNVEGDAANDADEEEVDDDDDEEDDDDDEEDERVPPPDLRFDEEGLLTFGEE